MVVPARAAEGAVLVTARSASVLTVVEAVAPLLPATGSVVSLVATAVLPRIAPAGTLGLTWATMVKVAEAPAIRGAIASPIEPPSFAGVNAGPDPWACETYVVPAGSVSERATTR